MPITDKLINQLLVGCNSPDDILGDAGLLKQLTKKVTERALNAEMEQHLGYAKHAPEGKSSGNSRNGKSTKTVRSVHGDIELDIPRDRKGTFTSQLIKKDEKQLGGFDDRIISLYARSITTAPRLLYSQSSTKDLPSRLRVSLSIAFWLLYK